MRFTGIRALPGPNVYMYRPALHATLELDELTEKESTDFPGFTERLLAVLPGLRDHHCSKGDPGGFVERLEEGTYFGHIVEHVCIELTVLAEVPVRHGKTRQADARGRYWVVVEYQAEQATRFLLEVARELVEAVLAKHDYPLGEKIAEAKRIVGRTELGPSTRAIADAATKRGIPWYRLDEGSLIQLGYGCKRKLVQATETQLTCSVAVDIAGDKERTKQLLDRAAVPVPRGIVVRTEEEAVAALTQLKPPLAVKPLDGNQGRGVSLDLLTPKEMRTAFRMASAISSNVIVEEYFQGRDYRVLVVNGKVVAAATREPAHVIGDGTHTIAQLVETENQNPARGEGHEKALTCLKVDEAVMEFLRRSGRTMESVPPAGEKVYLRQTANLSTGGTATDVTDNIHPDVARACERAARFVGLDVAGIDLILKDISEPMPESGGGVIEVNAAPGIRMHHFPAFGQPRDAGGAIVDMLFPNGSNGRIPIVTITGTNGKTTVTRMIGELVAGTRKTVGLTTTDGIWIDGHVIAHGDTTGFHSARTVLSDPSVEVAVLETARGGIVRRSLGYDWSDVGVMTNISADHLGQDGIHTIDDLVHIKSLVAERVREGGTIVLNADDERLVKLPENERIQRIPRRIVFFSLQRDNPVVLKHRRAQGTAYWAEDGWLMEGLGETEYRLVRVKDIPATLGGAARFQVANALAATAAARALGVPRGTIADVLPTFDSDRHNPGRMNLFRVGPGYVMMDYGHNPGAFAAMLDLVAQWPDRRTTCVFTVPGDREDSVLEEAGRTLAKGFSRLIIREDDDPRGRKRGEIADILCKAVSRAGRPCEVVLDQREALDRAITTMEEGEVVVFFYEKHEDLNDILQPYHPEPVHEQEVRGELAAV